MNESSQNVIIGRNLGTKRGSFVFFVIDTGLSETQGRSIFEAQRRPGGGWILKTKNLHNFLNFTEKIAYRFRLANPFLHVWIPSHVENDFGTPKNNLRILKGSKGKEKKNYHFAARTSFLSLHSFSKITKSSKTCAISILIRIFTDRCRTRSEMKISLSNRIRGSSRQLLLLSAT